ncbi:hypothetical protein J3A83DRAFT_4331370 [Scleroderma citrinum]
MHPKYKSSSLLCLTFFPPRTDILQCTSQLLLSLATLLITAILARIILSGMQNMHTRADDFSRNGFSSGLY